MPEYIVETIDLDFSFQKNNKILKEISMQVPEKSIYGFLGPNGAGKTTTLRLILGLLKKQKGQVLIFEKNIQNNRLDILRRVGSLIEQPSIYLHLTGRENLKVFGLSYNISLKRVDEVLDIVQLSYVSNKKAKNYSLGMKQRLGIAIALLNDPKVLILDEPTNGLDPGGIVEIRELLLHLNGTAGKTIIISSHLLTEIEKTATHVGIINKGQLIFQGKMADLQKLKSSATLIEVEVDEPARAKEILSSHFAIKNISQNQLTIELEDKEQIAVLAKILVTNNLRIYQLLSTTENLENLFIQLTKN